MRRDTFLGLSGLATMLGAGLAAPQAALALKNGEFVGRVDHVSDQNIKVTDPKTGQTLSFLLVPKFKNLWSDDGKTTYQMSFLHTGTPVKILYDQKTLGLRHADKIIVLKHV
jgi:hypothetical protein